MLMMLKMECRFMRVDGNPIFDRIKIIGSIPTGETDIDGNPIYETYTDYAVDSNGAVTCNKQHWRSLNDWKTCPRNI